MLLLSSLPKSWSVVARICSFCSSSNCCSRDGTFASDAFDGEDCSEGQLLGGEEQSSLFDLLDFAGDRDFLELDGRHMPRWMSMSSSGRNSGLKHRMGLGEREWSEQIAGSVSALGLALGLPASKVSNCRRSRSVASDSDTKSSRASRRVSSAKSRASLTV